MNLQRAAYKFKVGPYKIIPVEKKRCESTKRSLQLQDAALQYTSGLWHVPAALTTVGNLVQVHEQNEWLVRMGDDVPKFLYANGPARIVLYNYNVVTRR